MITNAANLIPEAVLEALTGSQPPVIFLGSGFGKEAVPALPTGDELAVATRNMLKISPGGEGLTEVLQYFKNASGHSHPKIVSWLKQQLRYGSTVPARPGGAHHLLLRLPVREFVTTNYDVLLYDAAKRIPDRTLLPIPEPDSFAAEGHPHEVALLAHIHGSFLNTDSIVATTDDFIELLEKQTWLPFIERLFRTRTVIFVGYSLRDFTTWHSYLSVLIRDYKHMPSHVLVSPQTGTHLTTYWSRYRIQYIPLTAGHFLIGAHDRLGTLTTNEDIATAAAAICRGKNMPDAEAEVAAEQLAFKYKDKTAAALRMIEEAGV